MHWLEGEDRPRCDCHDEPMISPANWRCRRNMLRYRQTPKGIETQKRYKHSSKGIEANHRSNARTLRLGDMYLGKIGFTQDETKEMIEHGETD